MDPNKLVVDEFIDGDKPGGKPPGYTGDLKGVYAHHTVAADGTENWVYQKRGTGDAANGVPDEVVFQDQPGINKEYAAAWQKGQSQANVEARRVTNATYERDSQSGALTKVTTYEDGRTAREQVQPTAGNQPSITGVSNTPSIAQRDAQGNVTQVPNPFYRPPAAAKTAGEVGITAQQQVTNANERVRLSMQQERNRLLTEVEQGNLNATAASQAFTKWKTENIDLPYKQLDEARAKATDERAAQAAERARAEAIANFGVSSNRFAEEAAQNQAQNAIAMVRYQVSPEGAAQIANNLNALTAGKKPSFSPTAGIIKPPDFEAIHAAATARALQQAGIDSPTGKLLLEQLQNPVARAAYGGITEPTADTFNSAPQYVPPQLRYQPTPIPATPAIGYGATGGAGTAVVDAPPYVPPADAGSADTSGYVPDETDQGY